MGARCVGIMDPMPLPAWFKGHHPSIHYVHKLHNIANNMKLAMELAYPAWNDHIYVWDRILPPWVPKTLDW